MVTVQKHIHTLPTHVFTQTVCCIYNHSLNWLLRINIILSIFSDLLVCCWGNGSSLIMAEDNRQPRRIHLNAHHSHKYALSFLNWALFQKRSRCNLAGYHSEDTVGLFSESLPALLTWTVDVCMLLCRQLCTVNSFPPPSTRFTFKQRCCQRANTYGG